MDTKEIIDAIVGNDLDLARQRVNQALAEKASESIQARKTEIATTYFHPQEVK